MERELITLIKQNFEYSNYLSDQGVDVQTTNHDDEVRICCPHCGESDYKCYVNDEKKAFCCFKCGFGRKGSGDLFDFVAAVEGIPSGLAFQRVCADFRTLAPDVIALVDEEDDEKPLPSFLNIKTIESLPVGSTLMEEDDEEAEPFFNYLVRRGLTVPEILGMRTHYTSPFSYIMTSKRKKIKLRDRVVWPVYGGAGDLVSWVSRTISDEPSQKSVKYVNAPETELAKTFWPFSPLPKTRKDAVLTEGILDTLAVRRAEYLSFACFGKRLSKEQIMLLEHWGAESLTIFFDQDAQREVLDTVDNLRLRFKHVYVVDTSDWPRKQDSGDLLAHPMGTEILKKALEKRIDVEDSLAFLRWRTQ